MLAKKFLLFIIKDYHQNRLLIEKQKKIFTAKRQQSFINGSTKVFIL